MTYNLSPKPSSPTWEEDVRGKTKPELRRYVRLLKQQFTAEELTEQSHLIINKVQAHPQLRVANTIFLYTSMPDEVNTHGLIQQLYDDGKRILLPVVVSPTEMELRLFRGWEAMECSSFGIMEPTGNYFDDYESIEFALIPGMAFDAECNRLGRGRGYYDRFLPLISRAYKLAVCFSFQFFAHIPTETTDLKVDEVLPGEAF